MEKITTDVLGKLFKDAHLTNVEFENFKQSIQLNDKYQVCVQICMAAVQEDGRGLRYITQQTPRYIWLQFNKIRALVNI